MKIALAQINPIVGDIPYNLKKILECIQKGKKTRVDLIIFPEMALCGYPAEDLLLLPSFIQALQKALQKIIQETGGIGVILGTVRENEGAGEKKLFNSAAYIVDGKLMGFQNKMLLPEYDVFSERRYFEPGTTFKLWDFKGQKLAITICEDMWQHSSSLIPSSYPHDPILEIKEKKPDLFINLSASPYYMRRHETRKRVCLNVQKTLKCPVLYCNQVGGNDSLVFDGHSLILNAKGDLVACGKGFEEDFIVYDLNENVPSIALEIDPMEELFSALVLGLRDYVEKQGFKGALLGLSGGIDSAVAAVIIKEALGEKNVLALSLPSRFTSQQSKEDASTLATNLRIELKEISIEEPFETFLSLLEPHFEGKKPDVTEENLQARIRGVILMAFSNKFGFLLMNTANKSELSVGYSTLYGDMCGALSLLGDVSKKNVYKLANWINRFEEIIPSNILKRAPSAELRFDQKDTDSLPEYDILDQVLEGYVEEHLSVEEIAQKYALELDLVRTLVRKIHLSEYKRRQAPLGLRVTKKAFSLGRRFPIVQKWNVSKL